MIVPNAYSKKKGQMRWALPQADVNYAQVRYFGAARLQLPERFGL